MIRLPNDISKFIDHTIEEIESHFIKHEDILFKEVKLPQTTIYIVYDNKIRFYLDRLVSYELKENGIIYKNNEDYYYFNFHEDYKRTEEIIKKFVENYHLG